MRFKSAVSKETSYLGRLYWGILLFISTWSCSADIDPSIEELYPIGYENDDLYPRVVADDDTIRVLIWGNSLCRDAFSYVPFVIESINPGTYVDIQLLVINGQTLSTHFDAIHNMYDTISVDRYTTDIGRWKTTNRKAFDKKWLLQAWDLVLFQESTKTSTSFPSTNSNVRNIVNYIRDNTQLQHAIGYMINPAPPEGAKSLNELTSDEFQSQIEETADSLLQHKTIDYLIPCGVAVQNARNTYLDAYGDFGHLSYEGRHLQEGLPCLIEAYSAAQIILNILAIPGDVNDCTLQVTQEWVKEKRIPGQHGTAVSVDEKDYQLAKRCAIEAVQSY